MNGSAIFSFVDTLQQTLEKAVFHGIVNLTDPLLILLSLLAIISIATNWGLYFDGNFNFGNIITKFLGIGFIAFLIRNWMQFMVMIKKSAEKLALVASNQSVTESHATMMTNNIAKIYTQMTLTMDNLSFTGEHILVLLLSVILLIICLICFFRIVFLSFMINAEFVIIGGLSIVLLPFGVTQWTKDIGNKPWGVLLTCAVKVLVVTFFLGLLTTFINDAFTVQNIGANTDKIAENLPSLLNSTIALVFLTFLIGQTTEFAGALTSGISIQSGNLLQAVQGVPRQVGDMYRGARTGYSVSRGGYHIGRRGYEYGKEAAGKIAERWRRWRSE